MKEIKSNEFSKFGSFINESKFWRFRINSYELDKWEAFNVCKDIEKIKGGETKILATYDPTFIRETYPHKDGLWRNEI